MKKVFTVLLWYISVMAFAFLLVYFLGYFMQLHENAYRDIFRCVTVPYVIHLIYLLWKDNLPILHRKKRDANSDDTGKSDIVPIKKAPSLSYKPVVLWGKLKAWFLEEQNVVYDILEVFMLLTVINSLLMVFGIDPSPKIGKFAYIHLMIRLAIISSIMIAIRGKETISDVKNLIYFFQKSHNDSVFKHCILANRKISIYRGTYVIYTLLTILICIFTIIFSSNPIGGIPFYFYLTCQFVAIVLVVGIISVALGARIKK